MKYDLAKTWPHPVLRPSPTGDGDYADAEFQVEAALDLADDATDVRVRAQFVLTADNLQEALAAGDAENVLLIRCAETFYRTSIPTADSKIEALFDSGKLSGPTELTGFIIATRAFSLCDSGQWHADYSADSFEVEAGDVLAQDTPVRAIIDTAENATIGSIFEHRAVEDLKPSMWQCNLGEERIVLELSSEDQQALLAIREGVNAPTGAYATVMNGIYLPALIYALVSADQEASERSDDDHYDERRWQRALNARLRETKLPEIGQRSTDRAKDAQTLLNSPFGRLLASETARERAG